MDYPDLAELRIKLLLKKSEGKATTSDLEQLDGLAKSMSVTASLAISEKDKEFKKYAEKTIAALESKSDLSNNPTDLDFSKS